MIRSITRRRILRVLLAIAIAVVSSPLALIAADTFLGLGSTLIVPLLTIAVCFTLSASEPGRRAWWFGFAVSVGICLPLSFLLEGLLHSYALHLQRLSQQGTISLSQRVIEPTLLILIFFLPLLAASLIGIFTGRVTRSFVRSTPTPVEPGTTSRSWQFSTRELLIGVAAGCLLLGWILGWSRSFQVVEQRNLANFVARFKASFASGEVKLLAEPIVDEQQRVLIPESGYRSFRSPGVNEYRVVAPIEKEGKQLWAVWAYVCNEEHREMIYGYGHAEAPSRDQLPVFPYPPRRIIEGTWELIDGVPMTAGPAATVVSVTSPARVDQPIILRASAPAGTVCELRIFPPDAVTTPLAPIKVGKSKTVQWSWQVGPEYAGYGVQYEVRCIEQRGASEMVSSTRGNVDFAGPRGD